MSDAVDIEEKEVQDETEDAQADLVGERKPMDWQDS